MMGTARTTCRSPLVGREGLIAIAFYTSEGVHAAMNAALRSGQRRAVLPFLPYLRLLLQVRERLVLVVAGWLAPWCSWFLTLVQLS